MSEEKEEVTLDSIDFQISSIRAWGYSEEKVVDILKDIVAYIRHSEKVLDASDEGMDWMGNEEEVIDHNLQWKDKDIGSEG